MTTAIRLQVVRFQCPHCRRTHSKKAAAEAHIARCWSNPAARGCKTCVHFTPADPDGPYPEHPGWPEQCEEGRKLLSGLHAGCPKWSPQTAPCAECTTPVPAGTTFCSARCRNAADCHDDLDGDL
ncbi:hypothetical protein PYK79_41315 [Streptomyces sp. ID05-04B]|nr:hypothetical protein [Streptomyces sp. ID05-04B]